MDAGLDRRRRHGDGSDYTGRGARASDPELGGLAGQRDDKHDGIHVPLPSPVNRLIQRTVTACGGAPQTKHRRMALILGVMCVILTGMLLYNMYRRDMLCLRSFTGVRPFYEENWHAGVGMLVEVGERLELFRSDFQLVEVFRNYYLGHVLVLDGDLQITERDEPIYHEMMVHVPLNYFGIGLRDTKDKVKNGQNGASERQPAAPVVRPRQKLRVLIIGGGDGGAVRQLLFHDEVEAITLVEIDPVVPKMSRKYFPSLGTSLEDPRVSVVHRSGADWVREQVSRLQGQGFEVAEGNSAPAEGRTATAPLATPASVPLANQGGEASGPTSEQGSAKEAEDDNDDEDDDDDDDDDDDNGTAPKFLGPYDIIFVDSTDYDSPLSRSHLSISSVEFYGNLKKLLVRTHLNALLVNADSPAWNLGIVSNVVQNLKANFKNAFPYQTHQPTFLSGHYAYVLASDHLHPFATRIDWDGWASKRVRTHYYTPDAHIGSFLLPRCAVSRDEFMMRPMESRLSLSELTPENVPAAAHMEDLAARDVGHESFNDKSKHRSQYDL